MIIDRNKNLIKELNRIKNPKRFNDLTEISKNLGFSSYNELYYKYNSKFIDEFLNKPSKNNSEFINTLKAGSIPDSTCDFWLESKNLSSHVYIVDSYKPSEKASLIYLKKLLSKKNKSTIYMTEDKYSFDKIKKFTLERDIKEISLEELCFKCENISYDLYIIFDILICKTTNSLVLNNIPASQREAIYNFLLNNRKSIEFTKEGLDEIEKEMPSDYTNINTSLIPLYEEVRSALIKSFNIIKSFLSDSYSKDKDIFLHLENKENILIYTQNSLNSLFTAFLIKCYFEFMIINFDIDRENLHKSIQNMIFPVLDLNENNTFSNILAHFERYMSISRSARCCHFFYCNSESENFYLKYNTSNAIVHLDKNIYKIKTRNEETIIEV